MIDSGNSSNNNDRRLLGAPDDEEPGDDVEYADAVDIDPLESAQESSKAGGQAYDEDERGLGGQGLQCAQQ